VTAVIEFFVEYEEQMFFVMNCDKVVNHGYLKQEEEKWYCKECGEYRDGKQMLELKATIADDSKNSMTAVTITRCFSTSRPLSSSTVISTGIISSGSSFSKSLSIPFLASNGEEIISELSLLYKTEN
jgi:hypothetical protein